MQSGMTFPAYLWTMGATSLLAWAAWALVIFRVDPGETGVLGLGLFYVTLFAGLVGALAVGGVLYRVLVLKRHQLVMREARISFRHALMLSFVAVGSLALSAQNLLTWWNILGVCLFVGAIEYLFVSIEESRRM
jgi:Ca2+/Na+ antiporter